MTSVSRLPSFSRGFFCIVSVFFFLSIFSGSVEAADTHSARPNILWLTSEDNSWNWLGCYGNREAQTPHLDALAQRGLRFTHAYSNGPVCAVARSTIINGAYAVTQGTHHMRSRYPIPAIYRSYVSYLRSAGYYCTNNAKTDFNFLGDDKAVWDVCSKTADYRNCPPGKPFFAVYNHEITHEGQLFPKAIEENRKNGLIPAVTRIAPSEINVPPYLPDLPEIRSDIAIYHDNVTAMDSMIGKRIDDLAKAGLADDTIIIYCSDHGGAIPRAKRYLEDTGIHVPLLIYIPEKWKALSPFIAGQSIDELVAFVDLAPTILSLCGIDKPSQMQGRPFLGSRRVEPATDAVAFFYADRFDETFGMRRSITDGTWQYLRCFTPRLPAAPYAGYTLGQAGWNAWHEAWQSGKLSAEFASIWESPQPVERLYNVSQDPYEVHDLARDPAHAQRLAQFRERLQRQMVEVRDIGIIPEPMYAELNPDKPIADYLALHQADLPMLVQRVFSAADGNVASVPQFIADLSNPSPVLRYWAAQGCMNVGAPAESACSKLESALADSSLAVRTAAAQALIALGRPVPATASLLADLRAARGEIPQLAILNGLAQSGTLSKVPKSWATNALAVESSIYLKAFAERIVAGK